MTGAVRAAGGDVWLAFRALVQTVPSILPAARLWEQLPAAATEAAPSLLLRSRGP